MNKIRPMSSYLSTKTLVLTVIFALFSRITVQQCKPIKEFDESDQPRLEQLMEMFDAQEGLIEDRSAAKQLFREDMRRIYSEDPDNFAKMVKFQILSPEDSDNGRLEELADAKTMTQVDRELVAKEGVRVSPEVTETYCVARHNKSIGRFNVIIIVSDRFRGTLYDIAEAEEVDARFVENMAPMSKRFEFYKHIMMAYKEISNQGWKHCDLRPQSIFYVEHRANFEEDYATGEEQLDYYPVIGEFGERMGLKQQCMLTQTTWLDFKDVDNSIKMDDENRPKTELSSLALLFIFNECAILTQIMKLKGIDEVQLGPYLLGLGEIKSKTLGRVDHEHFFRSNNLSEEFNTILKLIEEWKKGNKYDYSYKKELDDLKEFFGELRVFNYVLYQNLQIAEQSLQPLKKTYDEFLALLLEMSKENSLLMDKRPKIDEVIDKLLILQSEASENEGLERVRRSILLI